MRMNVVIVTDKKGADQSLSVNIEYTCFGATSLTEWRYNTVDHLPAHFIE